MISRFVSNAAFVRPYILSRYWIPWNEFRKDVAAHKPDKALKTEM